MSNTKQEGSNPWAMIHYAETKNSAECTRAMNVPGGIIVRVAKAKKVSGEWENTAIEMCFVQDAMVVPVDEDRKLGEIVPIASYAFRHENGEIDPESLDRLQAGIDDMTRGAKWVMVDDGAAAVLKEREAILKAGRLRLGTLKKPTERPYQELCSFLDYIERGNHHKEGYGAAEERSSPMGPADGCPIPAHHESCICNGEGGSR